MAKNEKILIIEDEVELAEMYKMRLEMEGYEVDTAYDGISGSEKATSGNYDLILLDLLLPKRSGEEIFYDIKNSPKSKSTPVIILTALGNQRKKDFAKEVKYFLVKSESTLEDVVKTVNEVVAKEVKKKAKVKS